MIKKYKVGIYIRLSKEDIDKKQDNSLSVENQIIALENYVNKNKYELYDTYIDDGYTGTNFERPSFKRMIDDIEQSKINMVVTKDLSRLGRDYIETGKSYIVCNYYRRTSKLKLCTPHYFNYEEVEKLIVNKIKDLFLNIDKTKLFKKLEKEMDIEIKKIDYINQINNLQNQINNKTKQLDNMYLDKIDNNISCDMYDRIYEKLINEIDVLKRKQIKIEEKNKNTDLIKMREKYYKIVNDFFELKEFNRSLMLKLIKKVKIYDNRNVDVYFNFNN